MKISNIHLGAIAFFQMVPGFISWTVKFKAPNVIIATLFTLLEVPLIQ